MKENYFYEGHIPSFSIYIMKKMFYNKEKESEDFHGNFNLYFCMYWFDIFVFGDTSNFVATGIIILLVVGIFLLYIRHKIKRNMEDIQKDADTYFEDSRQIYDDSVIDVEYSESDVHDEE